MKKNKSTALKNGKDKNMAIPKTSKELNLGPALGYDPDFGGLDLSGFPHLVARDDTPIDDGLAPLDSSGKGAGSSALKAFLTHPDREAIVALRDPEALRKFDKERGSGTTVYANEIPFQVYQRNGKWQAKGTVDGQLHRFTADSRDGVLGKVMEAIKKDTVRALTDAERLIVVRIAQSGDTQGAIVRYLSYALGDERGANYADHTEMLGDPALAEVFDSAATLTWYAARPNVSNSEEFSTFLDDYAGNRPLSHSLLDGAWAAFEKQQHRSALFAPVREAEKPATQRQLDDLDDASVERLMTDTKKQFAREVRAGVR